MPPKPKLNVNHFPRPPLLEKSPRHLQIKWNDVLIADTKDAYWVLETTHPPTYYLPRSSLCLSPPLTLTTTSHQSLCEYKGLATYHSLTQPSTQQTVHNRIWSYENPTKPFEKIKGYLSFYAGPWECFVDEERVEAQPGDFYGGWVTGEVTGKVKGS